MNKEEIKKIASKLKVDELLVVEALGKYCSPYGNDNPEMYAYIQGRKDEVKRYSNIEKQIPILLGVCHRLNILDAVEYIKDMKSLNESMQQTNVALVKKLLQYEVPFPLSPTEREGKMFSVEEMEAYGKQLLNDISNTFLNEDNLKKASLNDQAVIQAVGETILNFPLPSLNQTKPNDQRTN